jgi:predicted dehydrogenase
MEVYGETGYAIAVNSLTLRLRSHEQEAEKTLAVTVKETGVYEDPIAYFADVIRGKIKVPDHGPYSLENNMMVVKILDAARESATTGRKVSLKNR